MQNDISYFSHGRTALKYGIMNLDIKKGQSIFVPEFICDAAIEPLNQLNINSVFYRTNDDLTIDFKDIEKKLSKDKKALLIVHYFGNNQCIDEAIKFCNENKLFLIEDNAHGHGGTHKGKLLGTFGDIGFSSPRKLFSINYGGVLYSKHKTAHTPKLYKPSSLSIIKKKLKRNNESIIKSKKKYKNKVSSSYLLDMKIDNQSIKKLKLLDLNYEMKKRRKVYNYWNKISIDNNLKPVFSNLAEGSIPWGFPAYVKNENEKDEWIKLGEKNRVNIFSWPRLPKNIEELKSEAFQRTNKMIVFPIEFYMDNNYLDVIKHKTFLKQ